jgi:hypothetical protein
MSIDLRDPQIEKAVALIERRAERQADELTLYKGTRSEPSLDLFFEKSAHDAGDEFVPLDDRRSIRRIVLTRDVLEKYGRES